MLAIRDLTVEFGSPEGSGAAPTPTPTPAPAVVDVSLTVHPGRTLAVVGESGSGKSVTALAAMGLLPPGARITRGSITLEGVALPPPARRSAGRSLAMIFQEPMSALNPCMTIGDQVVEAVVRHQGLRGRAARAAAVEALAEVGLGDPAGTLGQYPHEFSGGMCQRVMIAMALACRPGYLLADEPTTALDVTVQAQILDLLERLKAEHGLGVLLITHDLGVVGERADAVGVMYGGRIVEYGAARGPSGVLRAPLHPYTRALLACAPRLDRAGGTGRPDRLPTVADMIDEGSLAVRTDRGVRRAWWPTAGGSPGSAPGLRRAGGMGGGMGGGGGERWICVHPEAGDPAESMFSSEAPALMRGGGGGR